MKPHKNSYCVIADKVYAGEYAGDLSNPREKINQICNFGITHFIDLTEDGELKPYVQLLPPDARYLRFPIKDVSVPPSYKRVYQLMGYINSVISNQKNKVYIHCWGGVGRTGTIVGCLYEYLGEDFEAAMTHLRNAFMECPKSAYRHTPETTEQMDFIRNFDIFLKTNNLKKAQTPAKKYTPEFISSLRPNEIFVFGSNLAGHHGGGAARAAHMKFGAVWGHGVGLQGQSYAIPTMQGGVDTIKPYVDRFIHFAKIHPELTFYVTRIGCGIAGFKDEEIAPLFRDALDVENIILPKSFVDLLVQAF